MSNDTPTEDTRSRIGRRLARRRHLHPSREARRHYGAGVQQAAQLVEREVKATLFDRNYDGVTATDSGRSFVAHILGEYSFLYRAVHEAQEAKHGQRHKLCIGVSAYLPANLIELLQSIELALYRDL